MLIKVHGMLRKKKKITPSAWTLEKNGFQVDKQKTHKQMSTLLLVHLKKILAV